MPKRVLLIDDNADLRLAVKSALELEGYAVYVAANGEPALAIQRRTPASILITDIFMPDKDGFEIIEAFRSEFPRVKIVAMSGASQAMGRRDYLAAASLIGVEATLRKPFKMDQLLRTLRSLHG